ncbi:MAG: methyl-accepting chemotaxis protein [Ignavibacteriales bacterium]|nr:MAG: methyl-accepting chemotaxis protein [Ignavibacteriales bacterium]
MRSWIKNLPVRQKLLYAFIVVMLFVVFVAGAGLRNASSGNEHLSEFDQKFLPKLDLLLQIDRDLQQALVAQRTLMFTQSGTAKFDELIADNEENTMQAKDRWQKFKDIELEGIDEALLKEHETDREEWIKHSQKIISLLSSGVPENREKAISISFNESAESFEKARDVIDKLTEIIEGILAAEYDESQENYSSAKMLMIIITIIALLLSVTSAISISNSISKPLTQAVNMMKDLKKGYIRSRIDYSNKNEIGVLAESMNSFGEILHSFTETMYKVSAGDFSTEIKKLDDADEITPALNKILETLRDVKKETESLTKAAIDGRLDTRGNEVKFSGGYSEIIKGINNTLDEMIKPVKEGSAVLEKMAAGDLKARVKGEYNGDHQIIKNSINQLGNSLGALISDVVESVQATASASVQISSSTEEMAAGSQEQSTQAAEIAGAVEEMTATILETSRNASKAAVNAKSSRDIAESGRLVINETVDGINRISEVVSKAAGTVKELGKSSNQIGEIIQVIDDIADQTNLLALNAAIEAARAGEQGRGFAVVADEVRKLAERTTKATKEIALMIKQIQKDTNDAVASMDAGTSEVDKGKTLAGKAGDSMQGIIKGINELVEIVEQVAAASNQQSVTAEQISKNTEAISTVTHESANGVQQIAATAGDLSKLTERLQNVVNKFSVDLNSKDSGYYVRSNGKLMR